MDGSNLIKELSSQLSSGTYECSVCSECVMLGQPLWYCRSCYGVFHLGCIATWVENQKREREKLLQVTSYANYDSRLDSKFRCPLCQSHNDINTTERYTCYCGKTDNPKPDALVVLGSCGQACERKQGDPNCVHRCVLMCHPGKCPPCTRTRIQKCYCGKSEKTVGCSSEIYGYECEQVCGKPLSCGSHTCTAECHEGPCPNCRVLQEVTCYCGAHSKKVRCGEGKSYSCGEVCRKKRDCGNHECGVLCHEGACQPCLRTPARQKFCPCGKTRLKVERTSCLDPVPTCGLVCEIPLACGHLCWLTCHDETPCAPCREMIEEKCPCGNKQLRYPCFCTYLDPSEWEAAAKVTGAPPESIPSSWPAKCNRPCRKNLSCNKHKCGEVCCTDTEHNCYQICSKKLSCGEHVCGQLCHAGPCPRCQHDSYERLYCRCRHSWIEPPVPCGTKPPRCNHPCSIPRPCGHPPNHPCHIEPECPPCVVLMEKNCSSHNSPMPYHMPCSKEQITCGKPCHKPLTCCGNTCKLLCHAGECKHKCTNAYPSFAEMAKK
ncbi:hypothetical protein AGDE_12885 [Angomonas deanei]|nr:hypothetical protein AGDE_12885 [Angomonas deanei]|eukprot:EPY23338.1 hypothetical protein AGDE_12885 [Angomonas deanei]